MIFIYFPTFQETGGGDVGVRERVGWRPREQGKGGAEGGVGMEGVGGRMGVLWVIINIEIKIRPNAFPLLLLSLPLPHPHHYLFPTFSRPLLLLSLLLFLTSKRHNTD